MDSIAIKNRLPTLLFLGTAILAYGGNSPAENSNLQEARTIEVIVANEIEFPVHEIRARPGESLRIVLRNTASKENSEVLHNINFLNRDLPDKELQESFLDINDDLTLPENLREICIGSSATIGPEQQSELRFRAPLEKGNYTFFCSVPGHVFIGMQGILIVE